MVEVDLGDEPREAFAEALLLGLRVVAQQEVGKEAETVVVVHAVRDRDRAMARDLERRLVGPGLGDGVGPDAAAQLVAEVVGLHAVAGRSDIPVRGGTDRHAQAILEVERPARVVAVRQHDLPRPSPPSNQSTPSGGAIGSISTPSSTR